MRIIKLWVWYIGVVYKRIRYSAMCRAQHKFGSLRHLDVIVRRRSQSLRMRTLKSAKVFVRPVLRSYYDSYNSAAQADALL